MVMEAARGRTKTVNNGVKQGQLRCYGDLTIGQKRNTYFDRIRNISDSPFVPTGSKFLENHRLWQCYRPHS